MKLFSLFVLGLVTSCLVSGANLKSNVLISGINKNNFDTVVKPQDDFYQYVNGNWLKTAKIPKDKASWGTFQILSENTENNLYSLLKTLNMESNLVKNSDKQKVAYLYASYMNESELNKLGITPILPLINMVDGLENKSEIAKMIAKLNIYGVPTPVELSVHQDAKNSDVVVVDLSQGGIGLPDRDYYLDTKDKTLSSIKSKYYDYITQMLRMSGYKNYRNEAQQILDIETKLAKIQWTNVDNRDPIKTYNKYLIKDLTKIMPSFDWNEYLFNSNIKGKVSYLIISQPSYLRGLNQLINSITLDDWKLYFRWQIINSYASYLSKDYHNCNFAFYGTVLSGIPSESPRYKMATKLVNQNLGFLLGKLYVKQYFSESSKKQMQQLVGNLIKEYTRSINELDWMSAKTKLAAQKKLSHMRLKIAYPDKWLDYSSLIIESNDLVGNLLRSNQFEYNYNINKLGKPVDKTRWGMTPQTVNAYYNPELNEIVFPAAILQPPFFNSHADNATNYGGIGAVIGHEISHAFDDEGSQYDESGNLHNWWTKADKKNFETKTAQLVKQYSLYSPIKGYYVNGQLTLGENIADNSGLSIAYKAYHLSLAGKTAPIIDGMTGDERFYVSWAAVWCNKTRDKQALLYLKTDPHSPGKFRANGALINQDGFYKTFNVKSGDKMYIKLESRVHIW